MQRKFLWFLLLIPILAVLFFFKTKLDQEKASTKLIYNTVTQKWEKYTKADPDQADRESILNNLAADDTMAGLYNPTVLKGYFDSYDQDQQLLTIKALVPFAQNLFELKQVKLLSGQSIYCTPAIYVDPNTGQAYQTKDLEIPVPEGETLSFHVEQLISFTDFLEGSTDQTFLHLQLTADYDATTTNYVKKILVIGLCE